MRREISRGDLVFRKTEECVSEVKQKEDDEEEEVVEDSHRGSVL